MTYKGWYAIKPNQPTLLLLTKAIIRIGEHSNYYYYHIYSLEFLTSALADSL